MSEQSLELLRRIRWRLRHAARRITLANLLFGFVLTLGIASALWLSSAAIEAGFWLQTGPRTALFWSLAIVAGGLFVYFLAVPLLRLAGILRGPSADSVAREIGDRFPEISDRLVNLLDLSEGRRSEAPDELIDGAVQMLGKEVDPVSFESVADFSRARRAVRLAAVPVLSLLLFLTAAPATFIDASKRILSPGEHFDRPAPFSLHVEPGSVEIPRGSALEIVVQAAGEEQPRSVELALNNTDEQHVETVRVSADSTGAFRHRIANVRRSFRYRAAAAPVTSRWHEVTVAEHPVVRSLQVTLYYPGYSGVPPQRLDANVGDVSGLPGTTVDLDVALGGSDAASALLRFDDGSDVPLEIDGGRAAGRFAISRKGTYQVVLENERGIRNRDPIEYAVNVQEDAAPSVVIVRPESDVVLSDDLRRLIETRISDDFGFHDLTLYYRLAESRFGQTSETYSSTNLPLSDPNRLDQDVLFDWNVGDSTSLDPVPGDVIEYYVRVRDNDEYRGYKATETPVQRLRLPSLAEQYERLSREQNATESQMEEMLQRARQLDDQFGDLRDEVRRKQDADWEDDRQLQDIEQQQRQLEEQVDDLSRQIDSMNRSAERNSLLSQETLEKYQEMQKVVEEINSPELREALRQLQESVESLDLSQMQQAIENFEFNEQQFQQRLERALELFKNLRAQQSLEEAARRAEELAGQQEQLAEMTEELMEEESPESRLSEELGEDEESNAEEAGQSEESNAEEGEIDEQPRDANARERSPESEDETGAAEERPESGDEASEADEQETPENRETGDGEASDPNEDRADEQPSDQADRQNEQGDTESPDESTSRQNESQQRSGEQEASPQERLARQQELSGDEMRQLEELLREAQRQLDELERGPADEMQQLNESVQQQQMPQQMQQNADQLRRNELQDAQSGQQQLQQQLQQLQDQLSQMQSGMQGSQMQVNMAGLRRALSDILTLSQDQEMLRRRLQSNVSEAPSMREDARRQVELSEGLSTVIDSLQTLGEHIPQMSRAVQRLSGQALREMGQATGAMTDRSVGEAAGHQTGAMMNLNELALLLSDVMNQLMNQAGGGGGGVNMQQMIQQMQEMAQQQEQLNSQIQQFLNDMQGNRLSVDMQQRLQQMGAQQQAIKRQLDELRRNPEARGNLLGDLDRIAEQMEETIQELQQRQVAPRTVERQRQILQRLLDAQRSVNERGREERREAREGEEFLRESPADLPPEEAAEQLRRDLIRALESGYAPDYEELIKRYFELLQQQQDTLEQE